MKKRILILCLLLSVAMLFSSCEIGKKKDNDECEHTFSEAWSSDATNHWHRATCEHGEVKGDLAAHVDAGQDGLCDVCGYEIGHEHTYAADWSSDESKHWKAATCAHADQKSSEGVHADDDKNYKCDVCEAHVHIVNPATGYCDDCGKQITVIDTSNMATVLNAIVANANKIVSGTVDYDAIFRGLSSDVTMAHDVEYNVYTDGLYTKRVEGAWANEVWKKMQGEGAIGLSIEKTNGALTKAEPVTADVEGLAGYYYAVSTLADGYGAEDILTALYELAKPAEGSLNKVSDFTESIDQTARTAKFSYSILVINTDTAEGEDDGANYYEVEVEFSYSEANALTSLKIVCDCYTNSLKDVAEHDYTYDQATKTITMKDTAKADTYTFIVAQTAGTQTAITMPATDSYVPTDLIIYADAAHTTVATTVTVDLGAHVDDIPVFYVGCNEGAFISFLDGVTVTVDKTGMTASLVGEQLQFYLQSAGTYVITLTSGSISKSVTVVVESDALWGTTEFEVTGTDNNTFDGQQYDFVAPVSGTYTIFVPAGCGAIDKADYDAWTGAPYVDPNNDREGGSFNVTLAAGQTYSFYFMVPTVGDAYTFSYNVVEHDVEIDDDDDDDGGEVTDNGTVTVGSNSVIITQAEYDANTASRTFAVTVSGNYKFAGDLFIGAVTDADGNAVTRNADYTYTLEAGKTYTITFSMLSNFGRVGANPLTITCESTSGGEEGGDDTTTIQGTYTGTDDWGNSPLTVVIDATTVTFNYSHPMMGDQTATYTYAIVDGAMVLYDENDNVLNPLAGKVTLTNGVPTAAAYNGTDYTLALGGSTGGDDEGDDEGGSGDTAGTAENPIVIETLPTTITQTGEHDVYYTYTVTEDCTIIISSVDGQMCDPTYQLDTYNDYAAGKFYIYARAGETVSINLYSPWGATAGDEFTYSITTAAYANEGDQARPFGMYQDGEFTCQYPGGNDVTKYVWYKVNIYDGGYFVINFADRVNAKYGTDLDNLANVMDATTKVEVAPGDVLYLAIQSFTLGEAEIAFTTGWEYAPGAYDNPYTAEVGDNNESIPAGAYEVYFAYTPAASGTITLTCTGASVYVYDSNVWDWVSADEFAVSAGVTYMIKVEGWEDGATEVAFNLAFEEKVVVITGELVKSQVIATPGNFAESEEYSFTAVAGKYIVNVTDKDTSTWFQIYDAASDSWTKYTDFPAEITLEAGEVNFRLYGWKDEVAGTPVTVEFYLVEEIEGGDDDDDQGAAGTMADPIVLSGAGNYDAIVPAGGIVYYTYTNTGASDVTFAFAVEGSNFWIYYGTYSFNLLDKQLSPGAPNPATVTVAAGATLYITIETYDGNADTINFSLTAEGGEASVGSGLKTDPYIIAGSGEFSAEVAANGEVFYAYTNDGASDVQVTLSFQGSNYYVAYGTYNFMLLDSMATPGAPNPVVTIAAGGTLYISVATYDYAADTIAFTVTVEATGTPGGAGSANVLVLGENAVDVTVTNYYANATTVTFTATEAGTYTLSAADGETNADVYITMGDWCELPYTFTLAAGETISFDVCSEDFMTVTEDTINLVLTKA